MTMRRQCKKLNFLLDSVTGEPYKGTTADRVSVASLADIADFRDAVKTENPNKLASIAPSDLLVYKNMAAFAKRKRENAAAAASEGTEEPLEVDSLIGDELGKSKNEAIIVVACNQYHHHSAVLALASAHFYPLPPPSPCRVAFFTKLAGAVATGDDDDWLEFLEDIPLTTNELKMIYIRACYKELATLIIQGDEKKKKTKSAILSGTPGIGKSLFLIYLMWILILEKKRVLYVCDPYMIYYDTEGRVFEYSPASLPLHTDHDFWNKDLWLLFDAKNRDRIEDASRMALPYDFCNLVLSTSPSRKIVNDPKKYIRMLFMPVWSEEEMQTLAQKIYYSQQDWKPRWAVLGGIPRLVFENTDEDATDIIREALGGLTLSSCISIVKSSSVFSDKSRDVIHRLVHICSSSDYKKQNIAFGSEEIARFIAFEKRSEDARSWYSQIESVCSHPKTRSLGGHLFEFYALDLLEKGGTFQCRELVHGNDLKNVPLPFQIFIPPSEQRRVVKKVERGQDPNILYIPETSNYAAIDAWIPGFGGFSMTVGKSHDLKRNVETDLPLLGESGNKLYWLLPSSNFYRFNTEKYPQSIAQYALCIPFNSLY